MASAPAPQDFPIIDISAINDPVSQRTLAEQITDASQTWGFLLLKNHSLPDQDIEKMFDLARVFFLDTPEEQKAPWPINGRYVGYNSPLSDRKKDDKASMWLSGKPGFLAGKGREGLPPFWQQHLESVESFKHACHGLIIKLLQCFALAMDLPDRDYFGQSPCGRRRQRECNSD